LASIQQLSSSLSEAQAPSSKTFGPMMFFLNGSLKLLIFLTEFIIDRMYFDGFSGCSCETLHVVAILSISSD